MVGLLEKKMSDFDSSFSLEESDLSLEEQDYDDVSEAYEVPQSILKTLEARA